MRENIAESKNSFKYTKTFYNQNINRIGNGEGDLFVSISGFTLQ